MAARKLGQGGETEVALQLIRDLRKMDGIAENKMAAAFLAEAEKLLSGE